jgi:hypothetical protein
MRSAVRLWFTAATSVSRDLNAPGKCLLNWWCTLAGRAALPETISRILWNPAMRRARWAPSNGWMAWMRFT